MKPAMKQAPKGAPVPPAMGAPKPQKGVIPDGYANGGKVKPVKGVKPMKPARKTK